MQSVSSRIWTRVAVYIFCNDNHYTTGTNSSNINNFTQCKHGYQMALKSSGYDAKFVYKHIEEAVDVRNREKEIL